MIGIRGRTGGYQLSKDPSIITIKDIVLAMNRIKKRKVEVSDIAKELYQSLETYMMDCISNVTLSSAIKDYIPRFSEAQTAPERRSYLPVEPTVATKPETKQKSDMQKVAQAPFKKIEEVPRGPNSVFTYGNYLTQV